MPNRAVNFDEAETPPSETTSSRGESIASEGWSGRAWLLAGPTIGLLGGTAAGLAEPVKRMWHVRGLMTPRLWLEALSFSLLSHVVFGVVLCICACLLGHLLARVSLGWRSRIGAWPLAVVVMPVGLSVITIWGIAVKRGADVLGGSFGLVTAILAVVLVSVPLAWLCTRLGSTALGGLSARAVKLAFVPAATLTLGAAGAQWTWRSQLQSVDGFWPIASRSPTSRPTGSPPDVVLIVCDTLRADRLGAYGYARPTSPHMDSFAADAVLFERAVSPGVWTQPSHASLFTGLYRSQHGVGWNMVWLDDRYVTLAEALRDHGYQTVALSNNPNVSPATNMVQGFSFFADPTRLSIVTRNCLYDFLRSVWANNRPLGPLFGRWFVCDNGGHATSLLAARVLEERDPARPLFLFINYMESHGPFESTRAHRKALIGPDDLAHSYRIPQSAQSVFIHILTDETIYSRRDLEIYSDMYDARVRQLDDCFADLMHTLAREMNLDDTLIILTSDHGENLGDHGLIGHNFCSYDTLAHVPLVVRWPRILKPQRVSSVVQTHDLFPTVLTWTGSAADQTAEVLVHSLAEAIKGTAMSAYRKAYTEYLYPPNWAFRMVQQHVPAFDPSPWMTAFHAVRDERWKLIIRSDRRNELYDLKTDPAETKNLAGLHSRHATRLTRQMANWRKSFKPFDPNSFTGPAKPRLDKHQVKRLRDLGYVQ